MTTLPPEGAGNQEAGNQPANDVPAATPLPPAAPVPPVTPAVPAAQPAVPQQPQYQVPPQQPQAPQYQVPPQQPQYQVPPQQPQQPQYQVPPQQPQAPQGGYGAPPAPGGYVQQPAVDPVSNITLNYWLSVFFNWIPALIFYVIEKDKGNPQARAYHADNLNFALLRVGVVVAAYILAVIPYIGWIFALALWVGSIVLFVFHIMAAAKAAEAFRAGQRPPFVFNIPMVK